MQNDFADPVGSLHVPGGEQIPAIVNGEIAAAIEAGSPVLYTQDWHPPITPHFQKDGGVWPVHCVAQTWGADLHPDLRVAGQQIRKGSGGEDGYSGFTMRALETGQETNTALDAILRQAHVSTVVIVGLATDYCVKETALDAIAHGFTTVVLPEAIRAVDLAPGDGHRAIATMVAAGVLLRP